MRIRAKNMMMHGRQTLQLPGPGRTQDLFSPQTKHTPTAPAPDSRQISREEAPEKGKNTERNYFPFFVKCEHNAKTSSLYSEHLNL